MSDAGIRVMVTPQEVGEKKLHKFLARVLIGLYFKAAKKTQNLTKNSIHELKKNTHTRTKFALEAARWYSIQGFELPQFSLVWYSTNFHTHPVPRIPVFSL